MSRVSFPVDARRGIRTLVRRAVPWLVLAAACGGAEGEGEGEADCRPEYLLDAEGDAVVADEAFRAFLSAEDRVEIDDAAAPAFVVPGDGAVLPAADPPTLTWAMPGGAGASRRHHGPPTTGEAFLVTIDPDDGCPASYVTNELSWPLSAEAWAAVGEGDHGARVTWAYFTENVITDGPYRASADRRFAVEP